MLNRRIVSDRIFFLGLLAVFAVVFTGVIVYAAGLAVDNRQLANDLKVSNAATAEWQNRFNSLQREQEFVSLQLPSVTNNLQQQYGSNQCSEQSVNLGYATVIMPCNWSMQFDFNPAPNPNSYGFAGPSALLYYNGTSARKSKTLITLTRYSNSLGNYEADPIAGQVNYWIGQGKQAYQLVNSVGTVFYTVKDTVNKVDYYYSQVTYKGDNYLVTINDDVSESQIPAARLLDSFKWSV